MPLTTETEVKTEPTLHEQALQSILERFPTAKRRGFWADARALWDELFKANDGSAGDPDFPKMHWIPDAHMIDHDRRKLVIFEVEDRWAIPRYKRAEMGEFWEVWEWMSFEGDWLPEFHIVNRFGAITHQLEGSDLFVEAMMQAAYDKRHPPKVNRYRRKFG